MAKSKRLGLTPLAELRLETCHMDLQNVVTQASVITPLTVVCGWRSKDEQEQAFITGHSKKRWPDSKHNTLVNNEPLSDAVDLAPAWWKEGRMIINWRDAAQFYYMAGHVMAVAYMLGIKLRYLGDGNRNGYVSDDKFKDLGHFERIP